jgi:hypothetical protein
VTCVRRAGHSARQRPDLPMSGWLAGG